ncbi:hypothetical protein RhiirB3_485503 [Rhizophagus irregularis]|nr:hypothetical protein RhiirB3_485503 [Rhizophagus irregularis]
MPDVHTIWNSSTLGEGKKLGSSPSNRYSTNILRRKVKAKKLRDSTSEELDKVINYALFLVDRCNEVIEEEKKGITKRDKKLYNENKRKKDEGEVEKNEIHETYRKNQKH